MMKKLFQTVGLLFLAGYLSSCATAPKPVPRSSLPTFRTTIEHSVGPGETFWRISKMYDVPVASILRANHLGSRDQLKMGQKLKIPGATARAKPVIALFPTKKWKYIIIHHSATSWGNALAFHRAHLNKGWDRGVGYHFIVDRGTSGKQDGQIEVSPRWIKQQDGSHCKAGDMNPKAIGICLVGDFNRNRVTTEQMDSLVYLVKILRKYYHIPMENIIQHGKVHGASTDCPGKKFPWEEFRRRIK